MGKTAKQGGPGDTNLKDCAFEVAPQSRQNSETSVWRPREGEFQGENGLQCLEVTLDAFPFCQPPYLTCQQALTVFPNLFFKTRPLKLTALYLFPPTRLED